MKKKALIAILVSIFTLSSISIPFANAASKPKCTGNNLKSYKKNLRIFNEQLATYLKYEDPYSWESQNYSASGIRELRKLSYENTLSYGGYLEKYAKICKVKMPKWWIDEWADFPDD